MVRYIVETVDEKKVEMFLETTLNNLPEWRRKKACDYHFNIDRYLCGRSFLLLKDLLKQYLDNNGELVFEYGEYGKPCIKGCPDIHFNISHCKRGIICAISDSPIGVDIEEIQFDEMVAKEVLNDEEYADVKGSELPSERFTAYWTEKESLLKLLGTGIVDDMRNLLFEKPSEISIRTIIDTKSGFVYSISH